MGVSEKDFEQFLAQASPEMRRSALNQLPVDHPVRAKLEGRTAEQTYQPADSTPRWLRALRFVGLWMLLIGLTVWMYTFKAIHWLAAKLHDLCLKGTKWCKARL